MIVYSDVQTYCIYKMERREENGREKDEGEFRFCHDFKCQIMSKNKIVYMKISCVVEL